MFKKYDTVKLTLSDDWLEALIKATESNTQITAELHSAEGQGDMQKIFERNHRIRSKLKKYVKDDGTVYLFKNEAAEIICMLLENYVWLNDFRENAMGLVQNAVDRAKRLAKEE